MNLEIKKLDSRAILPAYSYKDDAAFDLFSINDVELESGQKAQISTGIAMKIPENHVGLIWDKSGLSQKHGLKNLGGVIDSGYRGEVMIGIINLSSETYTIESGQKVAQMIIQKKETCEIVEVDDLDDSERGEKGFGSSGK